jgi:hypothetical protein
MTSEVFKSAFATSTELSKEEKEKLQQLRNNVVDLKLTEEQMEDDFLLKW